MHSTGKQGQNDHDDEDDDRAPDDTSNGAEHNNMSSIRTNRKNWPIVKFGDVVKNANLVERDLDAAGIERIVGLEHIFHKEGLSVVSICYHKD